MAQTFFNFNLNEFTKDLIAKLSIPVNKLYNVRCNLKLGYNMNICEQKLVEIYDGEGVYGLLANKK